MKIITSKNEVLLKLGQWGVKACSDLTEIGLNHVMTKLDEIEANDGVASSDDIKFIRERIENIVNEHNGYLTLIRKTEELNGEVIKSSIGF